MIICGEEKQKHDNTALSREGSLRHKEKCNKKEMFMRSWRRKLLKIHKSYYSPDFRSHSTFDFFFTLPGSLKFIFLFWLPFQFIFPSSIWKKTHCSYCCIDVVMRVEWEIVAMLLPRFSFGNLEKCLRMKLNLGLWGKCEEICNARVKFHNLRTFNSFLISHL